MARHVLRLDGWRPCLLNEFLRMHWARRQRRLRADAQLIGALAVVQGVPKAKGKRRVSLTVLCRTGTTRPDADALLKVTLDCLVRAHLLQDDNPDACEMGGVDYERAPRKGLVIALEDVP